MTHTKPSAWGQPLQQPDDRLIYLHIPKTAGSTLHSIFDSRFERSESVGLFARRLDAEDVIRLRRLSRSEKQGIRLLRGHQPFGLHRFLPGRSRYISLVREPISRLQSLYHYILQGPDWRRERIEKNDWSLVEFVESGISLGVNNGQVRWLSGTWEETPFGECPDTMLEQVLAQIDKHFAVVGPNDRFEDFIVALSILLRWDKAPFYRSRNRRKGGSNIRLSRDDVSRLSELNRLDIALYEHIQSKFDRLVQNLDNFEPRLKDLQRRRGSLAYRLRGFLRDRASGR